MANSPVMQTSIPKINEDLPEEKDSSPRRSVIFVQDNTASPLKMDKTLSSKNDSDGSNTDRGYNNLGNTMLTPQMPSGYINIEQGNKTNSQATIALKPD
jgi:hypothetical protein